MLPTSQQIEEPVRLPGIRRSGDLLYISEKPLLRDILLFLFFLCCTFYVMHETGAYNREIGIIVCTFSSLLFLHNCISLKRVKIDLRSKMIYRSNLNPFLILLEKCLRHPVKLSFQNIEGVYFGNREAFVPNVTKYNVIIRTDDPFELKIAAFTMEEDAQEFSTYLQNIIA
jgi:hypothetical protein